jgi:hypothetical protein
MAKSFRPWEVEQTWSLPPSVHELVPPTHAAHFVCELVRTELDLGAIYAAYDEERGYPPYHPARMTALLLYAYTQGPVLVAQDRARLRRARRRHGGHGAAAARLSPSAPTIR